MKIPDANVLIYAVNANAPRHAQAKHWLDNSLSGRVTVGFSWLVLLAFLRIMTNPKLWETPLSVSEAFAIVNGWLGARSARVLTIGNRHAERLEALLASSGTAGSLTSDAHLAALALEHKATIVTFDSDFGTFFDVKWEQPA